MGSNPGFDPYALDYSVCTNEKETKAAIKSLPDIVRKVLSRYMARETYQPCAGNPINNNWANEYLNRADVQEAINVKGRPKWEECSYSVGGSYSVASHRASMVPVYKELVANGTL